MSDAKKILDRKQHEAAKAGRLFLEALCGDSRSVGRKLVTDAARERGRPDVASVIDAEFEEGDDE